MKKQVDKNIGRRIRQKREALGYSRELLAERAEMSPTFLAEVELGVKGFSEATLIKLCHVLHVSADYILFGLEQPTDLEPVLALLSGLDEKYIPQTAALLAAYVKSIELAKQSEP